MRAHRGYLLTLENRNVRYVSDTGSRHQVFHVRASTDTYVRDIMASRDGRYVAITVRSLKDVHHDRVVVRRISHPRTIAQHRFSTPVVVASLTGGRALLTPDAVIPRRSLPEILTRWWNLHTGRLRLIDNAGRSGPGFDHSDPAADLTAGQVALVRGDHNRVVTIPRRAGRAWSTGAHEWVLSWSPDDRYVLTTSWTPEKPPTGNGWDDFAIRRARDGKLVTLFTGYQNLTGSPWSPVWEDATTFVADAASICDHGSCANITPVRCTIHGPCVQVAIPAGMSSIHERRLPPS